MQNNHPESEFSFDETYTQKEEMFGHPYQELQDFFKNYPKKGRVLDLGCGQGRDALFLAGLGYQVTAVDVSKVGIDQMMEQAKQRNLSINGIAADIFTVNLDGNFDIILFDMVLHGFDNKQQTALLKKYANLLNNNGIMCIVYPDDVNKNQFMDKLTALPGSWHLVEEIVVKDVPKIDGETINFEFRMMVVRYISDN